jgi:hypothetical protein
MSFITISLRPATCVLPRMDLLANLAESEAPAAVLADREVGRGS